jgi:hypothetical protein
MNGSIRMSGQRWARIMRDAPGDGGTGGGGGQPQGQQGGQGQGQQQQGQGQGGQGSGGGGSGQADDFWAQAGQGQQQAGQQGQGQQGQPQALTMEALQSALAAQAQTFQAEIDRRVNQIVNGGRRQQQGGNGQQQGQQQGNGQQQEPQAPAFDPAALQAEQDRRDARSAFREYVGDAVKFIGPDERALAHALGQQALQGVSQIVDPDIVGKQVADAVAQQIDKVRTLYRDQTIAVLRARGQYVEQRQGEPGAGSAAYGAPAGLPGSGQKHMTAAQAMAAEWNQRNGHEAPASANATN